MYHSLKLLTTSIDRKKTRSRRCSHEDGERTLCTRVTARNLGAAACRTSNKIILMTSLNYARGTNNNICPARIPAINIEGGPLLLSPFSPFPRRRSRNPRRAYPLHGVHLGEVHARLYGAEGPRSYQGGPCEKGPDLVAVILRSCRYISDLARRR